MRALFFGVLLLAAPSVAEMRVVDGDTLDDRGVRIRLFGIDAPERRSPGGQEAMEHLRWLVGSSPVICERIDFDWKYARPVALCRAGGIDLSLAMVRAGHAAVYCHFIRKLRPALLEDMLAGEAEAKRARRGIWARAMKPWREWRC